LGLSWRPSRTTFLRAVSLINGRRRGKPRRTTVHLARAEAPPYATPETFDIVAHGNADAAKRHQFYQLMPPRSVTRGQWLGRHRARLRIEAAWLATPRNSQATINRCPLGMRSTASDVVAPPNSIDVAHRCRDEPSTTPSPKARAFLTLMSAGLPIRQVGGTRTPPCVYVDVRVESVARPTEQLEGGGWHTKWNRSPRASAWGYTFRT
jgi:hypothetical protein